MPKIPGVNHLRAVKALEKAGFEVVRQGNCSKRLTTDNTDYTDPGIGETDLEGYRHEERQAKVS